MKGNKEVRKEDIFPLKSRREIRKVLDSSEYILLRVAGVNGFIIEHEDAVQEPTNIAYSVMVIVMLAAEYNCRKGPVQYIDFMKKVF